METPVQYMKSIPTICSDVFIVKVGLSPSKKICGICLIESPLKMMKNVFYFVLKALFVLKIFKFLSRHFDHVGKVIFKIHDATTWFTNNYNTHTTQYLTNSQNFGQLIDHNMRNIFLQKLCGNESGRLVPDLFLFF